MHVRLSRPFILEFYCLARQAERSVHRALPNPWPEFQAYYNDQKRQAITGMCRRLSALLPDEDNLPALRSAEDLEKELAPAGPISELGRYLYGMVFGRIRKSWSFSADEIRFFITQLSTLLQLLQEENRPSQEALIALRMDLCYCQLIVSQRCPGMGERARASQVEHFDKTPWLPSVTMEELVGACEGGWAETLSSRSKGSVRKA
jgi:hypothetical protein